MGQTLDEVRSNAMILSGIAQPNPFVQAVCVKFLYVKEVIGNLPEQFKHCKEWPMLGKAEVEAMQRLKAQSVDEKAKKDLLRDFDFDFIDNCCYLATFKIYQQTMFDELKLAACEFWGFGDPDEFILTDEYFNNLLTFKDTVQHFYAEGSGYQPLNSKCNACVFLIKKN